MKHRIQSILILSILFFLLLRFASIYFIQHERDLPIEPDDSYIYLLQSNIFYNDPQRKSDSIQSSLNIFDFNIQHNSKNDISLYYNNLLNSNGYVLFTSLIGFVIHKLSVDQITVFKSIPYVNQLVWIVALFLFSLVYLKDSLARSIFIFFCSFSYILFFHQLKGTPFSLGCGLFIALISYGLYKKQFAQISWNFKYFLLTLLITLCLFFHPGIIALLFYFQIYFLFDWFFLNNKESAMNLFSLTFVLLLFCIFYFFINIIFSGKFGLMNDVKQPMFGLLNNTIEYLNSAFLFNYDNTIKKVSSIFNFFGHHKLISICLLIMIIFNNYFKNKNLFFHLLIGLFLFVVASLVYVIPDHPGNLIFYFGEFLFILIALNYASFFSDVFFKNSSLIIKYDYSRIFLVLAIIFFLLKLSSVTNIIQKRHDRQNYKNNLSQIKEFSDNAPNDKVFVFDDLITYNKFLAVSNLSKKVIILNSEVLLPNIYHNNGKDFFYIGSNLDKLNIKNKSYEKKDLYDFLIID